MDVAIIECGMGGLLDATNVFEEVLCSVITSISMDHTDFLGDTLEKIAFNKAGIIKDHCPVVTCNRDEAVAKVIEQEAALKKSTAYTGKRCRIIGNRQFGAGTYIFLRRIRKS